MIVIRNSMYYQKEKIIQLSIRDNQDMKARAIRKLKFH